MIGSAAAVRVLAVGEATADALSAAGAARVEVSTDPFAALAALHAEGPRAVVVPAHALADRPRAALRALRAAAAPRPVVVWAPSGVVAPRVERAARAAGAVLAPSAEVALDALEAGPEGRGDEGGPPRRRRTAARDEAAFTDGCLRRLGAPTDLAQFVVRALARRTGAARASLLAFDAQRNGLLLRAVRGIDPALVDRVRVSPGSGLAGRAASVGRAVVGRAAPGGPRGYGGSAFVVLPLGPPDACEGVVSLTDFPGDRLPDERAVRSLVRMARRAGRSFAAARRIERAERQSHHDELTGLPNRRAFAAALAREVERVRRGTAPMALAIVDVDRFKGVNDRWGHPAGDRVLAAVAQRVAGALRASDMLARWGGEEFAVLLTELPPEEAPAAAAAALERARVAVAARPVPVPGTASPPTVSVSAGFVVFAGGPGTAEELLHRADEALYAAKNGGRNRVVSA